MLCLFRPLQPGEGQTPDLVLAVLLRDAPDGLPGSLAALRARGKGWEAKLLKALGKGGGGGGGSAGDVNRAMKPGRYDSR